MRRTMDANLSVLMSSIMSRHSLPSRPLIGDPMLGILGGLLVLLTVATACGLGDGRVSPASLSQSSSSATPTSTVHEANDDIAELSLLASMAMKVAREHMADPVLRQVDIGGRSGIQSFRFTNVSATMP